MKSIMIMIVFACALYACNNSPQTTNQANDSIQEKKVVAPDAATSKYMGSWIIPSPGKLGRIEGFKLQADSVAVSINTPTIAYEKWWHIGDTLIFTIKSVSERHPLTVNDSVVVFMVNDDSLVTAPIAAQNRKVVYRKQTTPNVALTIAKWKLANLDGVAVNDSSFIHFDSTGSKFTGFGGCNFIHGTYKTGMTTLRIGQLARTKKMCSSTISGTEDKLFAYIQSTNNYFIVGDELQLRQGLKTLAVFKAAY